MAKDRTRHARRRSGGFYRARRRARLVNSLRECAKGIGALGCTSAEAFARVLLFADSLGAWRCKALEEVESDDRRG